MTCDLAHEELAEFASGDLAPARAEVIRQHLAECDACRRRLELLSQVDAASFPPKSAARPPPKS